MFHPAGSGEYGVVVKYGPTSPWIEVYRGGVLTSEWQPSDGDVYQFLKMLLDNNLHGDGDADRLIQDGGLPYLVALL